MLRLIPLILLFAACSTRPPPAPISASQAPMIAKDLAERHGQAGNLSARLRAQVTFADPRPEDPKKTTTVIMELDLRSSLDGRLRLRLSKLEHTIIRGLFEPNDSFALSLTLPDGGPRGIVRSDLKTLGEKANAQAAALIASLRLLEDELRAGPIDPSLNWVPTTGAILPSLSATSAKGLTIQVELDDSKTLVRTKHLNRNSQKIASLLYSPDTQDCGSLRRTKKAILTLAGSAPMPVAIIELRDVPSFEAGTFVFTPPVGLPDLRVEDFLAAMESP